MESRRLFLAALLSLAVIILWSYLFPPKPVAKPPARPAAGVEETAPGATGSPAAPGAAVSGAPPGAASGATSAGAAPRPAWAVGRVAAAAESTVVLESPAARAVFSNRGAQLVSLVLKNQKAADEGGLDLVRKRAGGPYPYGLVDRGLEDHPLNRALFRVETLAEPERGGQGVLFRYSGPEGVAEKRFRFDGRGLIESAITVQGPAGWRVAIGPGIRNLTAEDLENRFELRGAVYRAGGETEQLDAKADPEVKRLSGETVQWAGLEDTYFLAAAVPSEGVGRMVVQPMLIQGVGAQGRFAPSPSNDEMTDEQKKLPRDFRLLIEPAGPSLSFLSYWGAKEYERLAALNLDLEETVRFGMFGILARPLLLGLHWIYDNVVANYGWAIVIMTALIRLLLLPLTHASMVSMKKMQELNPKVQDIRDRYKSKLKDKQGRPNLEMQRKMNDEVMALYRQAGVNPAGGCLPILLQMPILFAFYNLLTAAVELRGAPWMLWIQDLALKDPYYVLPIVMGLTQWLQVKMSPPAGDPMQRRIFELMPIFMTFLFLGFPSGLVLYWLTNNVLTIVQQRVYNQLRSREA